MDTECVKQLSLILSIIQNEKNNSRLIMFQEVERRKKIKIKLLPKSLEAPALKCFGLLCALFCYLYGLYFFNSLHSRVCYKYSNSNIYEAHQSHSKF